MNSFSAGYLIGKAAVTAANPNPTPRKFGQLQEVSVDDSFQEKLLFGTGSRPLRSFRGQGKTEIKAKFARINFSMFGDLYYAATPTTGSVGFQINEAHPVPASTPWQITLTPPGSGTAVEDLGVEYATTGVPLQVVASSPTIGQYSYAAGVYTFATADANAAVLISYSYTTTGGFTIAVPTLAMQEAPYFEVVLFNPNDSGYGMRFYKCTSNKLNRTFKQGEIVIPEMDISVVDPGTGVLWSEYSQVQ